jgi:hypothetical protein
VLPGAGCGDWSASSSFSFIYHIKLAPCRAEAGGFKLAPEIPGAIGCRLRGGLPSGLALIAYKQLDTSFPYLRSANPALITGRTPAEQIAARVTAPQTDPVRLSDEALASFASLTTWKIVRHVSTNKGILEVIPPLLYADVTRSGVTQVAKPARRRSVLLRTGRLGSLRYIAGA